MGLVAAVIMALGFGSCGGSPSAPIADPTTSAPVDTTTPGPLEPVRSSDPDQPLAVALGGRFELLLPADPTRGWRWVLEPVDTAVVVPLSSEFLDDPAVLASTAPSTTTTSSSSTEPATTWVPTTATTIDLDSPEAAPLVQVISFAGRSPATTSIELRYERIGGSTQRPRTVTFTVVVLLPQS